MAAISERGREKGNGKERLTEDKKGERERGKGGTAEETRLLLYAGPSPFLSGSGKYASREEVEKRRKF